jgi:hypothetical protein
MALGQKQSLRTMNLVVYSRPLHPELFEIHREQRIDQAAYDAAIWITGCAHVVRFSVGPDTISEVMAESHDELPERGLVASFQCRGEKQHEYDNGHGLHYQMSLEVEAMSEKLYAKTQNDLELGSAKGGLLVQFPQWRVGDLTPFCYVDYHVTPMSLQVFAYHAFPDELTMVKTQSIFELE